MSRSNFEIEAGSNKRESYAVTVKRFGQSDETLEITVEFQESGGRSTAEIAIARGVAPEFDNVEDPSPKLVVEKVCGHIRTFLMSFED